MPEAQDASQAGRLLLHCRTERIVVRVLNYGGGSRIPGQLAAPGEGGRSQTTAASRPLAFVHLLRRHGGVLNIPGSAAKEIPDFLLHQRRRAYRLGEERIEYGIEGAAEEVEDAEAEVQQPIDGLRVGSVESHKQEHPGGQSQEYEDGHHQEDHHHHFPVSRLPGQRRSCCFLSSTRRRRTGGLRHLIHGKGQGHADGTDQGRWHQEVPIAASRSEGLKLTLLGLLLARMLLLVKVPPQPELPRNCGIQPNERHYTGNKDQGEEYYVV